MLKTTAMILEELKSYASPADKLTRLVRQEKIFPIVKGLYETDKTVSGYLLAGSIYGPSYLSFEFALAYYGFIPEAVYTFTSATYEKKKKKSYRTSFGTFTYQDVPTKAYTYGIKLKQEGNYGFLIASPEKAICDQLYKSDVAKNYKEMKQLLFENLRIDEDNLSKLKHDDIAFLAEKYGSTNIKIFSKLLERM